MAREHLANYLNDHMAGSVAALEILQQLVKEAPELTGRILDLRAEIEADSQELSALMQRLGITESRVRKVGGWISEKFIEFKLNVDDPSDGALRRFESLEALAVGIDGKMALWCALQTASENSPELQGLDYLRLIQRAKGQRADVEVLRLQAAKSALCISGRRNNSG